MSVEVRLPPLLRPLSGGAPSLAAHGTDVASVMRGLCQSHPVFALHIFDEAGQIRPNIVFLHDGVLVRSFEAAAHPVRDGDEIVLTNALSGG